jgi:mannitol/fructose-specific phosphotransferase system IIA component (Ntr-type)
MNILSDSLLLTDIHPDLRTTDHRDALEEILSPLRADERVRDWEKLRGALISNAPNGNFDASPQTMLLHHGRTESVASLVLAMGRSRTGFGIPVQGDSIRLIFVAAIPEEMNNEYLRILGAIARVCREAETMEQLLAAPDAPSILRVLEKGCRQ